jgi:hypothetical protein
MGFSGFGGNEFGGAFIIIIIILLLFFCCAGNDEYITSTVKVQRLKNKPAFLSVAVVGIIGDLFLKATFSYMINWGEPYHL